MNTNLYYYWHRGEHDIPELFKENIDTFKKMNPQFKIHIIDDEKFESVCKQYQTWFSYWKRLNPKFYGMKSDFVRYVLLYHTGGLYMDIKSQLKIPVEEYIADYGDNQNVLISAHNSQKNWNHIDNIEYRTTPLYVCTSKHRLLRDILDKVCANIENYKKDYSYSSQGERVRRLTGHYNIRFCVDKFNYNDIKIIDPKLVHKYYITCRGFKGRQTDKEKLYGTTYYSKIKEPLVL
tara:strand:- start:5244 stop:5948 length:705 start_codon:yes stop_codon:yes gene_type:complete